MSWINLNICIKCLSLMKILIPGKVFFFKLKFHILFCICYTEKYTPVFKSFSSLYSMFDETQGVLLWSLVLLPYFDLSFLIPATFLIKEIPFSSSFFKQPVDTPATFCFRRLLSLVVWFQVLTKKSFEASFLLAFNLC